MRGAAHSRLPVAPPRATAGQLVAAAVWRQLRGVLRSALVSAAALARATAIVTLAATTHPRLRRD